MLFLSCPRRLVPFPLFTLYNNINISGYIFLTFVITTTNPEHLGPDRDGGMGWWEDVGVGRKGDVRI